MASNKIQVLGKALEVLDTSGDLSNYYVLLTNKVEAGDDRTLGAVRYDEYSEEIKQLVEDSKETITTLVTESEEKLNTLVETSEQKINDLVEETEEFLRGVVGTFEPNTPMTATIGIIETTVDIPTLEFTRDLAMCFVFNVGTENVVTVNGLQIYPEESGIFFWDGTTVTSMNFGGSAQRILSMISEGEVTLANALFENIHVKNSIYLGITDITGPEANRIHMNENSRFSFGSQIATPTVYAPNGFYVSQG